MHSFSNFNHTIKKIPPSKIFHPPLLEGNSESPFNTIWKTLLYEVVKKIWNNCNAKLWCQKLRNILQHFLLTAFILYWKESVYVNRKLFKNLYDKRFSFQLKSSFHSIWKIKISLWHFGNCNFYVQKRV